MTVRSHGLPQSTEEMLGGGRKKEKKNSYSGASLSMEMMMTCPIFKFLKSNREKYVF